MLDTLPFDIQQLHQAYQSGITPKAVLAECYRRISVQNDPGIFIHLPSMKDNSEQLKKLGEMDLEAKPLWGIPCAVKDNIDVAGMPTTAACPEFSYLPEEDAFLVKKLREAGAIIIGKTNLDQFATGLVGIRTPYPAPKNTLDPDIVPGGSSSGSAVVVSAGIVCFSLGTDTAGSGRVPAALNNIIGLKPSLGAFSATGIVPACRSLDTASVFALTCRDAYQVFQVCNAYDPEDAYSRDYANSPLCSMPAALTVAVPTPATRRFFGDELQASRYQADLDRLVELGATLVEIDFSPFYETADLLYEGAWVAERYAAIEAIISENPQFLQTATYTVISRATQYNAVDTFRNFYRLQALKQKTQPLIDSADIICLPTIPTFYSVSDLAADPIGPNSNLGTYTNFVNLLDLCGFAVPTPARADGRPGSVTLLAKAGNDALLASIADQIHATSQVKLGATRWSRPSYPTLPAAKSNYLDIAVVGAHMRDLPLNQQLQALDATFVREDSTSAEYQFYRLAGGPPLRPGLVKVANDDIKDALGASIALEIWRLPLANIGELLRQIPAPLSLGTLTLKNGDTVTGFLCEQVATEGAENITAYGGWRSYLAAQA